MLAGPRAWLRGASPLALVAGAGGALVVLALVVAMRRSNANDQASVDADAAAGEIIPWCSEGLEPIPGGGCFAAAASDAGEPKLVVYLHGRYAPTAAGTAEELERQARVARLATARGYSVLALRGRQGQCLAPEVADWWCWPSSERSADAGPALVAGFDPALAAAEMRIGKAKRFLLGFSNGGYFAALIATRALMPFTAIAIAGAGPVEPTRAIGSTPPILLLTADSDPSVTSMMLLDDELTRERWPHAIASRDGGHALLDSDVTLALGFFDRAPRERFPLAPPLSLHAPHPALEDGGADAEEPLPPAPVVHEGAGDDEAGTEEPVP